MHYSNKSYETEWSFLNHKKGNKNLRLKDTCTFMIEKLRIKHIIFVMNIYGTMTSMLKNQILFSIFFSIFFRHYFDIFFDVFDFFSIFCFD